MDTEENERGRAAALEAPRVVVSFGWAHRGKPDLSKKFVDAAVAAGAWAVKVSMRHSPSYFVSSRLGQWMHGEDGRVSFEAHCEAQELSPEALALVRSHASGKLRFVVAIHEETSLQRALAVSPDLISVGTAVACNKVLLRKAAETASQVLVEVNWLSLEELEELNRLFGPGRLILAWRDSSDQAFSHDRFENLFALKALLDFGRPVAYVGSCGRQSRLILALGFGASVLEIDFSVSGSAAVGEGDGALVDEDISALLSEIRRLSGVRPGSSATPVSSETMDMEDRTRLCVVASRDIPQGTRLTEELLAVKAPYSGISPRLMPRIIGKKALYDIPRDTPITLGLIEL